MTILDDRQLMDWPLVAAPRPTGGGRAHRPVVYRPAPARPGMVPLRHRGHGIAVSAAPHPARPRRTAVSTPVTVGLAGIAALITVWLGMLGQSGADQAAVSPAGAERLAVVRVQAGETLQQLAGRVSPDAPIQQVADRIRDLNELGSAAIEAGQTLIAPVG